MMIISRFILKLRRSVQESEGAGPSSVRFTRGQRSTATIAGLTDDMGHPLDHSFLNSEPMVSNELPRVEMLEVSPEDAPADTGHASTSGS